MPRKRYPKMKTPLVTEPRISEAAPTVLTEATQDEQSATRAALKLRASLEETLIGRLVLRLVGVLGISVLSGLYFQMVPLLLVLLGGYLGITRLELTVDVLIYGLSGFAVVLPLVYFYTKAVAALWHRLVFTSRPRVSRRTVK